jgi:excisionase family DNA binding protein
MSIALELPDDLVEAFAERVAGILDERIARQRWAEIEATAQYLGVSVRRVRELRGRGMPAKRVGRRLLFDLREVDAWLERQE